jgi:hypothetical protein
MSNSLPGMEDLDTIKLENATFHFPTAIKKGFLP